MEEAISPGTGGGGEGNACDFDQDPACGKPFCQTSLGCADDDLGCSLPVQWSFDLPAGLQDDPAGSCVDPSAPLYDHAWEWTAPVSGTFLIRHSTGWLTVRQGACDGPELACNENHAGPLDLVQVTLEEGETIVIVIEAVIERHFDLSLERVPVETTLCENGLDDDGDGRIDCDDPDCTPAADQDLGSAFPVTATATTDGAGDDFWGSSCGQPWSANGRGGADVAFRWRAPADGIYLVHTTGSSFDTLLTVNGSACPGSDLACDMRTGTGGDPSPWGSVQVSLHAGQEVVIVVDEVFPGRGGDVVLTIDEPAAGETSCADDRDDDGDGFPDCADPDCGDDAVCRGTACAERDLGGGLPIDVTGTIAGNDVGDVDCGGAFSADTALVWRAPADGTFLVSVTSGDFTPLLEARAGGCDGPITDCADWDCECDPIPEVKTVSARVALAGGQTVALFVEGQEGGRYRLQIVRSGSETACADGLDNDGDSLRDCADPDCHAALECQEEAACADGADQDVDGLVDCADPDCLPSVDHDLGSAFPVSVAGDTTGKTSDYQISGCSEEGVNVSPDEAWRWVAPAAGTYTFAVSTDRTVVSLRAPACGTGELDCSEFRPVTRAFAAGEEVIVAIMPFQHAAPVGPYTLTITSP